MHDIHWALIFSNGTILLALAALVSAFIWSGQRDKNKPKIIGSGDKVKVKLATTGESHVGVVEGVSNTTALPGRFYIICNKQAP